jgi:7-carboxy-7-deazaguanine synthase
MTYSVKEIYYTLQGEGAQTGRPAVFLRFAGCNLWSGRERDRSTAVCKFCDTEFVGTDGPGGGKFGDADALADAVAAHWRPSRPGGTVPYVVCTGGEPLLQLDDAAIAALHERGFEVGVETNGTRRAPGALDWICVSPKAGAEVLQRRGDELKLVYPQVEPEAQPERFESFDFTHHFLQPLYVSRDDSRRRENTRAAIEYCLRHPRWKLSLQTHKFIGIP